MDPIKAIQARNEGQLAGGAKLKSGCVHLAPGESIGEHSTEAGEELILVLQGQAKVLANDVSIDLRKEECVFLPQATVHNVINQGHDNLIYIYIVGGK